jgi:hypothetical protein
MYVSLYDRTASCYHFIFVYGLYYNALLLYDKLHFVPTCNQDDFHIHTSLYSW